MFQNSFINRLNLRCPIHYNNRITHACPKPNCQKNCLLCQQCMNTKIMKQQHYGHQYELQKIDKYLQSLSTAILEQKPQIQKLFKKILEQKQNETLLKWQKQKLQHFQSIQNHLNTLKFQVDQQITNIIDRLQNQLIKEKEKIYLELENYFQTYKMKFNNFAQLTQPVVMMQQNFVFYISKNNLSLKLMSTEPSKLNKWLNSLKFNLNRAQLATRKQVEYINRVQNLGFVTNQLMDQLPRFRNVDVQSQLPTILKQSSRNILNTMISFRRSSAGLQQNPNNSISNNPNSYINRSNSMNYIPAQNSRSTSANNKEASHQKKYYTQQIVNI